MLHIEKRKYHWWVIGRDPVSGWYEVFRCVYHVYLLVYWVFTCSTAKKLFVQDLAGGPWQSWELECHQSPSSDYPILLLQKPNSAGYYFTCNIMMANSSETETFLWKGAHLFPLRKRDYPCITDTGMFMARCGAFLIQSSVKLAGMCRQLAGSLQYRLY